MSSTAPLTAETAIPGAKVIRVAPARYAGEVSTINRYNPSAVNAAGSLGVLRLIDAKGAAFPQAFNADAPDECSWELLLDDKETAR